MTYESNLFNINMYKVGKEFRIIFPGYLNMCYINMRVDNWLGISYCNQVIGCRVCRVLSTNSPLLIRLI